MIAIDDTYLDRREEARRQYVITMTAKIAHERSLSLDDARLIAQSLLDNLISAGLI